jgi:D-glycero-beta-D-manno-heptose 1-phosphate adenylyltransferase
MKAGLHLPHKIYTLPNLLRQVKVWRLQGKSIALTNGVFDVVHKGHIASITEAASYADVLIVAINNDESVKRLKGPTRPINDEMARALLMASFLQTDAIVLFEDDTPLELIKSILPDVLVKGGDYTVEQIAGAKEVMEAGGKVILAEIIPNISSTAIIQKMKANNE